jgi:hypothetical protein
LEACGDFVFLSYREKVLKPFTDRLLPSKSTEGTAGLTTYALITGACTPTTYAL